MLTQKQRRLRDHDTQRLGGLEIDDKLAILSGFLGAHGLSLSEADQTARTFQVQQNTHVAATRWRDGLGFVFTVSLCLGFLSELKRNRRFRQGLLNKPTFETGL